MKEKFQSFRQHLSDAPWFRFLMDKINTPMLYVVYVLLFTPYSMKKFFLPSQPLLKDLWVVLYIAFTLFTALRSLDVYEEGHWKSAGSLLLLLLLGPFIYFLLYLLP